MQNEVYFTHTLKMRFLDWIFSLIKNKKRTKYRTSAVLQLVGLTGEYKEEKVRQCLEDRISKVNVDYRLMVILDARYQEYQRTLENINRRAALLKQFVAWLRAYQIRLKENLYDPIARSKTLKIRDAEKALAEASCQVLRHRGWYEAELKDYKEQLDTLCFPLDYTQVRNEYCQSVFLEIGQDEAHPLGQWMKHSLYDRNVLGLIFEYAGWRSNKLPSLKL